MGNPIKDKALQDRFLDAVKGLSLRFEVADISKATGIGEPTVSTYLNSGRQVSRPFLRKFCEVYELDYDYINTGRKKNERATNQYFSADQLFAMFLEVSGKQTAILQSIESKMAQEKTQAMINKKLSSVEDKITEALAGIDTIVDQSDEILRAFPSQISKGEHEKKNLSEDVDNKRGGSVGGVHKRGKSDGGHT